MSVRSSNNQSLQNYPKIQIDRGNVIKPCVNNQNAADQFIDKPVSSWKKIIYDTWHEGVPFILRCISSLSVPVNSNPYYVFFIKCLRYIALLMLHIHRVYLYIYGYFYPYSLMSLDEVCDQFSRCPKWTEAVIRAFAWHPNYDKCAVAICNDYIYVYQSPQRKRVLRHNHQHKIVDMAWQPTQQDVLVVATQTNIIVWRVSENQGVSCAFRDKIRGSNLTYLAPGSHLMKNDKSKSQVNGNSEHEPQNTPCDKNSSSHGSEKDNINVKVIENILPPPIISIQFDQSGNKLYACSPNSSKIAILDIHNLFNSGGLSSNKDDDHIDYLRRFGQGVTRLLWSPEKNRLATATTSSFFRVFEPYQWTCKSWPTPGVAIQDMVWSKPTGRLLLIANKSEPYLYALSFLDNPQAKDAGGNKSLMKALDLTATSGEFGDMVGGRIQSFAWDKNGKRLAISFKDNPESILLYKTVEKPTVEFHQLGVIQSDNGSCPLLMEFHDKYKHGSLLTICWSDGFCQHVPLNYVIQEETNSLNHVNSPPRSLTNFCYVSQNNSLLPVNKVQHQTTLFSLSPS